MKLHQVGSARFGRSIGTAFVAATLTACGGSDAPDLPCGGTQSLSVAFAYEVNGMLLDATHTMVLQRDAPLTAIPRVVGLPAACASSAHVSVKSTSVDVPAGLALDRGTGVLSGTATQRSVLNFQLMLTVDGYANPIVQNIGFFM